MRLGDRQVKNGMPTGRGYVDEQERVDSWAEALPSAPIVPPSIRMQRGRGLFYGPAAHQLGSYNSNWTSIKFASLDGTRV